jgi:hypothetical protein
LVSAAAASVSDEISPAKLDEVTELITDEADSGGLQKKNNDHYKFKKIDKFQTTGGPRNSW